MMGVLPGKLPPACLTDKTVALLKGDVVGTLGGLVVRHLFISTDFISKLYFYPLRLRDEDLWEETGDLELIRVIGE